MDLQISNHSTHVPICYQNSHAKRRSFHFCFPPPASESNGELLKDALLTQTTWQHAPLPVPWCGCGGGSTRRYTCKPGQNSCGQQVGSNTEFSIHFHSDAAMMSSGHDRPRWGMCAHCTVGNVRLRVAGTRSTPLPARPTFGPSTSGLSFWARIVCSVLIWVGSLQVLQYLQGAPVGWEGVDLQPFRHRLLCVKKASLIICARKLNLNFPDWSCNFALQILEALSCTLQISFLRMAAWQLLHRTRLTAHCRNLALSGLWA